MILPNPFARLRPWGQSCKIDSISPVKKGKNRKTWRKRPDSP